MVYMSRHYEETPRKHCTHSPKWTLDSVKYGINDISIFLIVFMSWSTRSRCWELTPLVRMHPSPCAWGWDQVKSSLHWIPCLFASVSICGRSIPSISVLHRVIICSRLTALVKGIFGAIEQNLLHQLNMISHRAFEWIAVLSYFVLETDIAGFVSRVCRDASNLEDSHSDNIKG